MIAIKTIFDRRPSEYRIREQLPNGQKVNLYFVRNKGHDNFYQWHVGFYIGDRKEANKWFNHHPRKRKNEIKGNGTLTALRWALKHILEFVYRLKNNEELIIGWEDEKRKRAYQFLKRYGFVEYYDESGEFTHLGIRNPDLWEYVGDE